MQHYSDFWRNYANFSGRTSRAGYWTVWLINTIISFLLGLLGNYIPAVSFVAGIYSLAILIPSLAICIRRLRDAGYSWGWYFLNLIPLIGSIIVIVMLCKASKYDDVVPAAAAPAAQWAEPPAQQLASPAVQQLASPAVQAAPPAEWDVPATQMIPPAAPQMVTPPRSIALCCQNTPLAGRVWQSSGNDILIGRDPKSCTVCFPQGIPGVSREHCRVFLHNGEWYLQDLMSTYGTYAGGKRLNNGEQYLLRTGENIFLGSQQVWLTVR